MYVAVALTDYVEDLGQTVRRNITVLKMIKLFTVPIPVPISSPHRCPHFTSPFSLPSPSPSMFSSKFTSPFPSTSPSPFPSSSNVNDIETKGK